MNRAILRPRSPVRRRRVALRREFKIAERSRQLCLCVLQRCNVTIRLFITSECATSVRPPSHMVSSSSSLSLCQYTVIHVYIRRRSEQVTHGISSALLAFYVPTVYHGGTRFIALVLSLVCGVLPNAVRAAVFEGNSAATRDREPLMPFSRKRSGPRTPARRKEQSYLIDEALCKFYCTGSPLCRNTREFISRVWKRAGHSRSRESYCRVFRRLQVCPTVESAFGAANGN